MDGTIDELLGRLKGVCEQIASGRYEELDQLFDLTADADLPAVIGELAEAFASMAVQVEAREFRLTEMLADLNEAHRRLDEAHKRISQENTGLRGEVARLRIEIDHGKRDREVTEIAETDYFKGLKARAQNMRDHYHRRPSVGADGEASA